MSNYRTSSPYYSTPIKGFYLDVIDYRSIPKSTNDIEYEILPQYENRPDLLAYDLYDNANLWWVFAVRNPDIIKDPIFGMVSGIKIYLPTKETLRKSLGI